jgi:hypothetical protein
LNDPPVPNSIFLEQRRLRFGDPYQGLWVR